jgi:membrane-bound inhibitor of C-type lysozyme
MTLTRLHWTHARTGAGLATLALLAACAQPGPAATASERVVRYACDRGETLEVRYRNHPDIAVLS